VVSITAARKGQPEIAVGNILGLNIFNSFAVMCAVVHWHPDDSGEYPVVRLPVMVIATLMYLFTTRNREITRWEGATLLLMYLLFVYALFGTL